MTTAWNGDNYVHVMQQKISIQFRTCLRTCKFHCKCMYLPVSSSLKIKTDLSWGIRETILFTLPGWWLSATRFPGWKQSNSRPQHCGWLTPPYMECPIRTTKWCGFWSQAIIYSECRDDSIFTCSEEGKGLVVVFN